jgi:hypothetical protein
MKPLSLILIIIATLVRISNDKEPRHGRQETTDTSRQR